MKVQKSLSLDKLEKIVALLKSGVTSSRKIASIVGCGKSTVNNYRKELQIDSTGTVGARIAIVDTETAATIAALFGRFNINLSQSNIITEGGWLLCAAWRWLGEDTTYGVSLSPEEIANQDDSKIVSALYTVYLEADAIVAHNAIGFDHKVIQTRALANGMPPLPSVKIIDTLSLAKKHLKLPSNKLDSIGEYFKLGRKFSTGGISLWIRVQSGDEEAMHEMQKYCIQDVDLLHDIYLKLRHVGSAGSDFNAGLYYDDLLIRCRTCGSAAIEKTGREIKTGLSAFDEYRCTDCGAIHRNRQSKTTKEKRKALLM